MESLGISEDETDVVVPAWVVASFIERSVVRPCVVGAEVVMPDLDVFAVVSEFSTVLV